MFNINDLDQHRSKIKFDVSGDSLVCVIRKKAIKSTSEELVRQLIIHFLLEKYNISKNYIAVEKQIELHSTKKRFDILIYDKFTKPLILIECKKSEHKLSQQDLDQLSRYNIVMNAPYSILTNGKQIIICEYKNKEFSFLNELPEESYWSAYY